MIGEWRKLRTQRERVLYLCLILSGASLAVIGAALFVAGRGAIGVYDLALVAYSASFAAFELATPERRRASPAGVIGLVLFGFLALMLVVRGMNG